jgi:hypothetical protein
MFIFARRRALKNHPTLQRLRARPAPWPKRLVHPRGFSRHLELRNDYLLTVEAACRTILVTSRSARIVLVGFQSAIPFERLGVRELHLFQPVQPEDGEPNEGAQLTNAIVRFLRKRKGTSYLAIYRRRTSAFSKASPLSHALTRKYEVVLDDIDLTVWKLSTHLAER